jgi:hypothetical protein
MVGPRTAWWAANVPARRRAIAWGVLAVAAYAALAGWSGRMSPLARGPLLDGTVPGAAYRWVEPPPDLAPTNVPPSAGDFRIRLGDDGSFPDVLITNDNQVTIVPQRGSIRARPGQTEVRFRIDPLGPSTFADPPDELVPFGNVYRIRATYEPSDEPVRRFDRPPIAILVYPATPNLHATNHVVLYSKDGSRWTELDTQDSLAQQQAQAELAQAGYVMVAAVPAAIPTPPAGSATDAGSRTLSTVLLVAAGCSLLIGIGLLLRGRGGG